MKNTLENAAVTDDLISSYQNGINHIKHVINGINDLLRIDLKSKWKEFVKNVKNDSKEELVRMEFDEKVIKVMEILGADMNQAYNDLPDSQLFNETISGKMKSLNEEKKEIGPGEEVRREEMNKLLKDLRKLHKDFGNIGPMVAELKNMIKEFVTGREADLEECFERIVEKNFVSDAHVDELISFWQYARLNSIWKNMINYIQNVDAESEREELVKAGKVALEKACYKLSEKFSNDSDLTSEDKAVFQENKLREELILAQEFAMDRDKKVIKKMKTVKATIDQFYGRLLDHKDFFDKIGGEIESLNKKKDSEPDEEGKQEINKLLNNLEEIQKDFYEIGTTVAEKQKLIKQIVTGAEEGIEKSLAEISKLSFINDEDFKSLLEGMDNIRNIDPESEFKGIIGYGENLSKEEEQILKNYENNKVVVSIGEEKLIQNVIKAKQSKLENTILNYRGFIEKMKPFRESIDKVLSREHYFDHVLEDKINILNTKKDSEPDGNKEEIEKQIEYLSDLLGGYGIDIFNASQNKDKIDELVNYSNEKIKELNQEKSNLSSKEITIDPSMTVSVHSPANLDDQLFKVWQSAIDKIKHLDPKDVAERLNNKGVGAVLLKNKSFLYLLTNDSDKKDIALSPIYLRSKEVFFEDLIGIQEKVIEKMNKLSSSISKAYNDLPERQLFYYMIDDKIRSLNGQKGSELGEQGKQKEINKQLIDLGRLREDYTYILDTVNVKQRIIKEVIGNADTIKEKRRKERNDLNSEIDVYKNIRNGNEKDVVPQVSSSPDGTMSEPPPLARRPQS
ncbi:hypothetical protein V1387_18255, partial [Allomuricauda taeanensis]|uniref:hypothetical protein n=1 Tax=Flagellimonas taeanensis TaxID=1005926 RepID=UPI002E7AB002